MIMAPCGLLVLNKPLKALHKTCITLKNEKLEGKNSLRYIKCEDINIPQEKKYERMTPFILQEEKSCGDLLVNLAELPTREEV